MLYMTLEHQNIFVTTKAYKELGDDSKMENSTTYHGYCRLPYAVFTVHFLKLGFNFTM